MKLISAGALSALFLTLTLFATVPLSSNAASNAIGPDPANLVGRWLRTDGGYILQLTDPEPEGQLKAAYFNPQPIHVAVAAWKHEEGYLGAFVELRAPNYPGSNYTLAYDDERDRLVGIYFHAGQKQKYQVEFERIP